MQPARQHAKPRGLPVKLRFCKACASETTHEVRRASGVVAQICRACLQRTLKHWSEPR